MSVKTLVIDDESAFIGNLESIASSYPDKLQIIGNARSVKEGLLKIDELEPELIFLDIQMADGTGFDLLEQCDRRDFKVIFVTAYDQYAIEAFRFSAVDYLLKPVVSTDFWEAVERATEEIEKSKTELRLNVLIDNIHSLSTENKKIVLREVDFLHIVKLEDILWCVADGSYTHFHLVDGSKVIVSQHLKEYEEILDKNGFFRAHRSYLVNVNKITKFDKRNGGVIHLEGNISLPLSVRIKDKLLEVFTKLF